MSAYPEHLDVEAIRTDFPALARTVRNDNPLVYLDSGATPSQRRVAPVRSQSCCHGTRLA